MAETTLGALAEIKVGFPFKSGDFLKDGTGVRLLRGDNIAPGRVRWDNAVCWPATAVIAAEYWVARGDVVLAMDRPWIGAGLKAATIGEGDTPALLVQRVARLRARSGVPPGYIAALAASETFAQYLLSVQTGTAVPHISARQIAAFPVTTVSRTTQSAIAEVLGALDDKIAANTRVIDLLDQLGTAKVRRHTTGALVALSSIAVITMGSSPPGADLSDVPTGIPFYQGVRDFGKRFPGFRVWTEKPVRIAEVGDTLLSVRAPVGRTNLARVRSCIGRGVASLRSTTGMPFTLFHILATSESAWLPFESEGTVFGSINRTQLGAVLVPTIESSVQTRLESCLASFESQIAATIAANERLATTRDALLPALMSGKLRIKDAERVVSDAV